MKTLASCGPASPGYNARPEIPAGRLVDCVTRAVLRDTCPNPPCHNGSSCYFKRLDKCAGYEMAATGV